MMCSLCIALRQQCENCARIARIEANIARLNERTEEEEA